MWAPCITAPRRGNGVNLAQAPVYARYALATYGSAGLTIGELRALKPSQTGGAIDITERKQAIERLPLSVVADRILLQKVVASLVINAVQAAPSSWSSCR
jgi:hypothetical protein